MDRETRIALAVCCSVWFGGHRCARRCIAGSQLRLGGDAHAQILQQAVAKAIDPTMDGQRLTATPGMAHDTACEQDVRNTAMSIGRNAELQAMQSLSGIEAVIRGLAQIRERKTLVLISAGLPVADRSVIDLQLHPDVVAIGRLAAAANLNLFVLHIDSGFLDAFSAEERTISDTLFRDLSMMSSGLDTIAGESGGSLARVVAGADFAFDRVLRETAASYLLGVEPAESDRDGKPHRINVKVRVSNAEVRSRREFVMPKADAKPATPDEALMAAFWADRLETGLPIRLATHSKHGKLSLTTTGKNLR